MKAAHAGALFEVGIGTLAVVAGVLVGTPTLSLVRVSARAIVLGTVATIPLAVGLYTLLHVPGEPLRRIEATLDAVLRPLFADATVGDLLVLAAAAGIGEELLFRGVVQGAAARALGPDLGVVIGAVLFGVAHAVTGTYAVLAGLVGVFLGALALVTGNLVVPIVAHALYDFGALVYWLRMRPPRDGTFTDA
jgi:membrane protease YdiL (CAAX protease family)